VSRYAIHNPSVHLVCKKVGSNSPDLSSPSGTTLDTIKTVYGIALANELVAFSGEDEDLHYSASGYATNSRYSARKKSMLLLFINNRLVGIFYP
jgi:DNA mismatch repair protein MLH1